MRSRERCATCRFWDPAAEDCHRHAPIPLVLAARGADGLDEPVAVWPRTPPDGWCGEWVSLDGEVSGADSSSAPTARDLAAQLFLRRLSPAVETADPVGFLGPLLGHLPPDVLRVVTRVHGLDGRPPVGLKDAAREERISGARVRSLLAIGERRVRDALDLVVARQHHRRADAAPSLNGW
jgi:hypothetical protein